MKALDLLSSFHRRVEAALPRSLRRAWKGSYVRPLRGRGPGVGGRTVLLELHVLPFGPKYGQ
jgi:hypothetical protein